MNTYELNDSIIFLSRVGDGIGRRTLKNLMELLFRNLVEQSSRYMDTVNEAPYSFSEKQIHSIFAPSLAKLTDSFLMEQPISRQWSKRKKLNMKDSHGWLDYWCRYKGYDYFIELKHNYDAFRTDNIKDSLLKNWKLMNSQLSVVRKDAKEYRKNCKGVFLVSLHFVTVYETCSSNKDPKSFADNLRLKEIQKNYFNSDQLKPSPNWSALWVVPKSYVRSTYKELKLNYQYYPSIMVLANVSELIN